MKPPKLKVDVRRKRIMTSLKSILGKNTEPTHFLVQNAGGCRTRFSTYGEVVPSHLEHKYLWFGGAPLQEEPDNPVVFKQSLDEPLQDYLVTTTSGFLVSKRLATIAVAMSSCVREYPARIERNGVVISDDYVSINFERKWDCLDLRKSKYEQGKPNGFAVERVMRLVLDDKRIPNGENIFRIGECPMHLIADQSFKTEAEKSRITGMEFVDFRGKRIP